MYRFWGGGGGCISQGCEKRALASSCLPVLMEHLGPHWLDENVTAIWGILHEDFRSLCIVDCDCVAEEY